MQLVCINARIHMHRNIHILEVHTHMKHTHAMKYTCISKAAPNAGRLCLRCFTITVAVFVVAIVAVNDLACNLTFTLSATTTTATFF